MPASTPASTCAPVQEADKPATEQARRLAHPAILPPQFSARLQAQAIRNFEATGVNVRLGVRVTAVSNCHALSTEAMECVSMRASL